jgi:hypothetical protein
MILSPIGRRASACAAAALLLACGGDPSAPPAAASVSISAAGQIRVGDTVAARATVRDAAGNALQGRAVTWRSEAPEVATIADGRLIGLNAGTTRIEAASDGVVGALTVRVASHPVVAIWVEPRDVALTVGDSVRLSITMRDAAGRLVTDRAPALYESFFIPPVVLGADGWLRARWGGSATLTVAVDQGRADFRVRVAERPLAAIRFEQRRAIVEPGAEVIVSLLGTTQDGRTLEITPSTIVSADTAIVRRGTKPSVAGPQPAWLADRPGATEFVATYEERTATMAVEVVAPVSSAFDVDVRWFIEQNPAVTASIAGAIARWRRVVVGDLRDQRVTLPEGGCFPGSPAMDEDVDDLMVLVYTGTLDGRGGVLAQAGPCAERDGGPPAVGVIHVDAADIGTITQATPWIETVLAHEIGHILGIGTTWDAHVGGFSSVDPHFVGPSARRAAGDFGYEEFEERGIPIEIVGRGGTVGSHWRESALPRELMTGWLDDRGMALSHMTVGALRDLGYVVHEARAERMLTPIPWASGVSARREGPAGGAPALSQQVRRASYVLDLDGSARPARRP